MGNYNIRTAHIPGLNNQVADSVSIQFPEISSSVSRGLCPILVTRPLGQVMVQDGARFAATALTALSVLCVSMCFVLRLNVICGLNQTDQP